LEFEKNTTVVDIEREIEERMQTFSQELKSKEDLKRLLLQRMNDPNDSFLEDLFKKIKMKEKFGSLIN
jgi:hypothetical protein